MSIQWYDGIQIRQDPDAVLDWQLDLTDWLEGDTIQSATVDGGGLTVGNVVTTDTSITVWLSGGTAGTNYTVRIRFTTTAGRTDDRSITVVVAER